MPFRTLAELQPILALLAGTPEADALELVLVTARATVADVLAKLGEAFDFYGLAGGLVVASGAEPLPAQLDLGVEATAGEHLLAWSPSALPKAPGWLARLLAEAATLPAPGLLSPALTYEDGSIYFGGATGQPGGWLPRGPARPVPAGAAEIALIGRGVLRDAGGFSGHLFSDAHAHADLAERLRRTGGAAWCSGGVEFWMLDDPAAEPTPLEQDAPPGRRGPPRPARAPLAPRKPHEGPHRQPRPPDLLDRRRAGRVLQPLPGPEGPGRLGRALPRRRRTTRRPPPRHAADVTRPGP